MNLDFLILIILLKNVYSYKPDRKIETASNLKPNKKIAITPARYQIANKNTNMDAVINPASPVDNFPAMEYPTNLMDSSKPFYITTSPFPNDVKTSFDLIISTSKKKGGITDYSAIKDEIAKAKDKFTSIRKQDFEANNKTTIDIITNRDYIEKWAEIGELVLDFEDPLANWTTTAESYEDIDYVLSFIKDLDEGITNSTDIDFEIDDQNSTECSNEMQSTADDAAKYNVSSIELYGNTFSLTFLEQNQSYSIFDEFDTGDNPLNIARRLVTNESEITSTSNIDDMLESFFGIGKTANETSCEDGL